MIVVAFAVNRGLLDVNRDQGEQGTGERSRTEVGLPRIGSVKKPPIHRVRGMPEDVLGRRE